MVEFNDVFFFFVFLVVFKGLFLERGERSLFWGKGFIKRDRGWGVDMIGFILYTGELLLREVKLFVYRYKVGKWRG